MNQGGMWIALKVNLDWMWMALKGEPRLDIDGVEAKSRLSVFVWMGCRGHEGR